MRKATTNWAAAIPLLLTCLLLLATQSFEAAGANLPNPILFVTQVPIPDERNDNVVSNVVLSCVSAFGNHLADTRHTPRGGDLMILYTNGVLKNITRLNGFGTGGPNGWSDIAVRQPSIHWSGKKAVFSMVVGAPQSAADTNTFYWQLYEVTNITDSAQSPLITKIANQPTNYNNVSPCYGTDDRIIFTCDRPRDGSSHLYPQLDEYTDRPTVTGLWSLDTNTADLFLLTHTPSGAFTPFVDSFGRVIFTRWDHLVQDRNATGDRLIGTPNSTTNGTVNFLSESNNAPYVSSTNSVEFFPEARTFDTTNLTPLQVNGNAFNEFFPWQINEQGGAEEFLNHAGRHELVQQISKSFTNAAETNLVNFSNPLTRFNTNYLFNCFHIREDPTNRGTYFAIDAPDFGTHASGQIITLNNFAANSNADFVTISYVTPKATANPNSSGGLYRTPVPLTNGLLLASHTLGATVDANTNTAQNPKPIYMYQLKTLTKSGATWVLGGPLITNGFFTNVSYYVGTNLIGTNALNYNGQLWELDAAEVVSRNRPPMTNSVVDPIEAKVFRDEGIDLNRMQAWLRSNNLAMIISRNVTKRDHADRQQPFNLNIAHSATQTLGANGVSPVYNIEHLQLIQADQLRGLTLGTNTALTPGRRVLATPHHDAVVYNVPDPGPGATNGTIRLGDDGSFAAIVPARRAMTWQLTDTNNLPVVRERYWITFQPGEIRTCANCHGINQTDQTGLPNTKPTNAPAALRTLLAYFRTQQNLDTNVPALFSSVNGASGSGLNLGFNANPWLTYSVQATTNFPNWSYLTNGVIGTNGVFGINDPSATNFNWRFYRVTWP